MTNRINRLESQGLVERHRESADRSSIYVRLTAMGSQLVESILSEVLESEQRRLERFTTAKGRDQWRVCCSFSYWILEADG